MVTTLGTYLGTALGTELGGMQDVSGFDTRLLYALATDASNNYATAVDAGEAGVAAGFGLVVLAQLVSVPNVAAIALVQRGSGAGTDGHRFYATSGAALQLRAASGAASLVAHTSRVFLASDVGKIFGLVMRHTGTGLVATVAGETLGFTPTAITGYTPSTGLAHQLGLHPQFRYVAHTAYRGTPSDADLQAMLMAARVMGDLPASAANATVTHRWSLRDVLAGLDLPVVDGQTAPASLPDTVTAATIDAMARQGSPTLRVIDPSVDGRKSYGALGFSATNRLETASGAGIAGQLAGFHVATRAIITSLTGQEVLAGRSVVGTSGWIIYRNAAALQFVCYTGSGNISSPTYTLTAADLNVPRYVHGVLDGARVRIFVESVEIGNPGTAIAAYAPAAQPTGISHPTLPFGGSGFDLAGGHSVPTPAEIAQNYADSVRLNALQPIAGKSEHLWRPGEDIIANGGPDNGIPLTVQDRIGTDHLTRVGVAVQTGPNSVRGVGPYSSADYFTTVTTGGLRGHASGHHVVVDFVVPSFAGIVGLHAVASCTNTAATNGWAVQISSTTVRASVNGVQTSLSLAAAGIASGQRARVLLDYDGANVTLYANSGTPSTPTAVGAYVAPSGAMVFGHFGGPTVQPFISGWAELVQGGDNQRLSPAEITALFADLTQPPPIVPGKTLKRWRLEDDVTAAGGALPTMSTERISGGDSLVRIGAPLQVAQRAERVWSYETTPILYGATGLNDTNYYHTATGSGDDATAFGGTLVWIPRAGSSATRALLSGLLVTPTRGWDIRTTGTNALVSALIANGANAGQASPTIALTAFHGKICAFSFQWDGPNNRLRAYLNRVEGGSGSAITGHAIGDGSVRLGATSGSTGAPGTDNELFGFELWTGIASLAQVQAQHDAILANDGRIQHMPGVTSTMLVDLTLDALANGGTLGATLSERIGGVNNFTRTGAPTTVSQYARTFGF